MSELVTNNLDFGTGDTYKLQDARVDSMYTNAQIDSAMGNKVDKVSGKGLSTEDFTTAEKTKLTNLTQPNNSTITIRQGGVVKGTFTVDSSQDVTIDIDAGGGGVDAYTKAESDARYPSKTYFDVDKVNVSDSSYKIELGYDNEIHRACIAIGEDNTVSNNYSNILIGYFNNCRSYMDSFDGVVIGYMNDASNYDYNVIIGSKIYNSVITQDYEVAIGYGDKPMSVKPNGEVYSRGDVSCDDGSGNRVSLRDIKAIKTINVTVDTTKVSSKQGYTRCFEQNGAIFLSISLLLYAFTPSAWTKIASIPSEYAPQYDYYFTAQDAINEFKTYICYVGNDGNIYMRGSSVVNGATLRGNVCYLKGK